MVVLYTYDTNGDLVWKITDFGFAAPSSADMSEELNPLKTGHMTRNYCAQKLLLDLDASKAQIYGPRVLFFTNLPRGIPVYYRG